MPKHRIQLILLCVGLSLSLFLGLAGYITFDVDICSDSCTAVHDSSFGSIFGIPVGIYAAVFLISLITLTLLRKNHLVIYGLAIMVGAEAYMTILQVVHIQSLCAWCLAFFAILILTAAFFIEKSSAKSALALSAFACLFAHFVFFPPGTDLKANLLVENNKPQIEVFVSPSCTHCKEAIVNLHVFCDGNNFDLILRPVGLSASDRELSVDWVCKSLFDKHNSTSKRISEKIVWKNEKAARNINGGQLSVPIIVIRNEGTENVYKGWNEKIKETISGSFSKDLALSSASFQSGFLGSDLNALNQTPDGNLCGKDIPGACNGS